MSDTQSNSDVTIEISIELNGRTVTDRVAPGESLRAFLRRHGMFSVKYGSPSGETGAGAVLVDGRLVSSDVLLAAQVDGHTVTTVEVLNTERDLHPIQMAFTATGAMQSGYSAGAMILGTMALLAPTEAELLAEIRDMLSGILDRETAYVKVVEAVQRAAVERVREAITAIGFGRIEEIESPIRGAEGNREFLLWGSELQRSELRRSERSTA